MQKAANLVSLLVLGWTWTLQGLPVVPEPLYPIQENFDLTKFLGTWNEIAIASTNRQLLRMEPIRGKVLLESLPENKLIGTKTVMRNGTCEQFSESFEMTNTPGRFLFHVAKMGIDIDGYVVHTNYIEYAITIMILQWPNGRNTTIFKLYDRTMDVRAAVLEDFKTQVRGLGMSDENIVIKADKGDCVPGEQVKEPNQPEPQRTKRDVVPSLPAVDLEGSGDDTPLFNGTEACLAAPETGPCFGLIQRYFYNSSSMSCELFKYGGCLGNQNNFENEKECLQRCRTEAVCRLPMAALPCTGHPSIWAFDSAAGLCVAYKDGFCQANANKFYSKAECEEYCGVMKDDAELLSVN